jgi:tetratricopeptide (TPR) repeat protein
MLGLELPEDDPQLGEACEHRGEALAGLKRYDDAVAAFERALTNAIARHDDAGIERAAMGASDCLAWLARPSESLVPLRRGLDALANDAARERALLLAQSAWSRLTPAHLDEAWQSIDEARALAERVGDPHVDARVLTSLAFSHRLCGEYEAASASARSALPAVRAGSAWGVANLLFNLVLTEQYRGNFSACDALLPELEAAARRGSHHGALWLHERVQHAIELARTGNIRTYLEHSQVALRGPQLRYVARSYVAAATLYLGAVEEALEHVATVAAEQPTEHWYAGMPEGNRFAATALAGRADAEGLIPALLPWLPVAGRRNVEGAYFALETLVTGLAVMGDRERRAGLYPLTLASVQNGRVYTTVTVGPSSPQLVAALAADAAGLHDQAREHFETALRQAREVPIRILQPTVLYWYGRALSTATDASDQLRGRAMVEAALTDFRGLEMVLHANLAERFLRDGR